MCLCRDGASGMQCQWPNWRFILCKAPADAASLCSIEQGLSVDMYIRVKREAIF